MPKIANEISSPSVWVIIKQTGEGSRQRPRRGGGGGGGGGAETKMWKW